MILFCEISHTVLYKSFRSWGSPSTFCNVRAGKSCGQVARGAGRTYLDGASVGDDGVLFVIVPQTALRQVSQQVVVHDLGRRADVMERRNSCVIVLKTFLNR